MANSQDKPRNRKGDGRGMNPASQKNLIGAINLAGRPPKAVCITSWLKEYAAQQISTPIDPKNLTYAQAAALSAWKLAAKGELASYNFIIERIEGKVAQGVDVTSKGNELKASPIIQVVDVATRELYLNGRRTLSEADNDLQAKLPGVVSGKEAST
jgi:hypothetical protein